MPLTEAQVLVLTNPQVRQRLPTKKGDFAYADSLLRDVGKTCPRLPAVWDRIFSGLDTMTANWLNTTFPGFKFAGGTVAKPAPYIPPRTIVTKAIEVLQSYKKSP